MQPYLFPYIGYWQLINSVDTFVIYDDVNFIKKGYINRNNILINNQKYQFTLELQGASQNKLIKDIQVGSNGLKILKTIERGYKKAPYFYDVFPIIKDILEQDEKNIAKFIGYSIEQISQYLQINTKFIYSSDIQKDTNLKGKEKIIAICKALNASHYINAVGGLELYDKNSFEEENIRLDFLKSDSLEYKQFNQNFIPYLSILDIMMFNSVSEIKLNLQDYQLI